MSSEDENDLRIAALAAIESTDLSAIEHLALRFFVDKAVSRGQTSQYILDLVSQHPTGAENALRSMKNDLIVIGRKFLRDSPINPTVAAALHERERSRCCVSGTDANLKPTYIVSPSILEDEDLLPGGRLRPLLEATLSTKLTEGVFSTVKSCGSQDQLKNLWLMSSSPRSAFRAGHIAVRKPRSGWFIDVRFPEIFPVEGLQGDEFYVQPSTPDPSRLPLPDEVLIQAHRSVSLALHFLSVEADVKAGWEGFDDDVPMLGSLGINMFRGFFRLLPNFLRLRIHGLILKAVDRWNPQGDPGFKRLPFGLGLKFGRRVSQNEANALRLVEKHTAIPAPRLIDFAVDPDEEENFLLMTLVPGIPAELVFWRMTYEERDQLVRDVGAYVGQYRRIPNQNNYLICDTIGGPLVDKRTEDYGVCGPFNSKSDFIDYLTEGLERRRNQLPLSYLYDKDHRICFTHADLHLSNLMLKNGRLCGIIDWENAGFRPEFWDYTVAMWSSLAGERFERQFRLAFDKDYEEELEAERLLMRLRPVF